MKPAMIYLKEISGFLFLVISHCQKSKKTNESMLYYNLPHFWSKQYSIA